MLQNNEITDVTPLTGLASVEELDLRNNQISDIKPLLDILHLQKVDLRGNPIDDDATIEKLRANGTTVLVSDKEEVEEPDLAEVFPDEIGFVVADDGRRVEMSLDEEEKKSSLSLSKEQMETMQTKNLAMTVKKVPLLLVFQQDLANITVQHQ